MTISKKQLVEAEQRGFHLGTAHGKALQEKAYNATKVSSEISMLKAAAELANANAKLTYAMSRMITGGN